MRIGECLCDLRFFLFLFLVCEKNHKAVTYVGSSAYKPAREMEVMLNYAALSYV